MLVSRNRRGITETRVDQYRHPDTGKTVTLVGMLHVAEPAFYKTVADLADDLERRGAEVHYELTQRPKPWDLMTDEERALIKRIRENNNITLVAKAIGLETQHTLKEKPEWVNTDMTMLEMIREHRYPETLASNNEALRAALTDEQYGPLVARFALWVYRHVGILAAVRAPLAVLTVRNREDRRVIIKMRNQVAIDAAIAAPRDVVALWGGEHLTGIGAGLRAHGYRLTRRVWLRALSKHHKIPEAEAASA